MSYIKPLKTLPAKQVVVLGAGMAGWLTALFLKKYLGSKLDVTLVAPDSISPMTVGESTNGPFTGFLNDLGITTKDIIRHCDGTLKIASEFTGWNQPGKGYDWVHEFQSTKSVNGVQPFHTWLKLVTEGRINDSYQDANFINKALVDQFRVPFTSVDSTSAFNIGYHLDSQLLAIKVQEKAEQLGVKYINAKFDRPTLQNNLVQNIVLDSGKTVDGDLFIDCTGFSRLLMKSAYPRNQFLSLKARFPNNSAVYTNIPTDRDNIRPSTKGTALTAGWVWDIPLQSRTSIGYVFSKTHLSKEKAIEELGKLYGIKTDDVRYIEWNPGYMEKAWVGNVVSIGVSNAFIEPIESLTSAMLTFELNTLLLNFPSKFMPTSVVRIYNEKIRSQCIDNSDFISLHYHTATRQDSDFWLERRSEKYLSNRIIRFMNEYKQQAPMVVDGIYDSKAIYGMLTSREIFPEYENYLATVFSDMRKSEEQLNKIKDDKLNLEKYITHLQFIQALV